MDANYRQALRAIPFLSREQLYELSSAIREAARENDLREARAALPFTARGHRIERVESVIDSQGRAFFRLDPVCGASQFWETVPKEQVTLTCKRCLSERVDLRRQQERGGR